jgi:hypothetical protein
MRKTLISLIAVAVTLPLVTVFAQQNPPVSKTFKAGKDCKIVLAEDKAGALTDLKAGDKIGIAYHEDGATSVADRIHLAVEAKVGDKDGKPHDGTKKADSDKHVRGIITAVDTTAGTVTVEVHQKAAAAK